MVPRRLGGLFVSSSLEFLLRLLFIRKRQSRKHDVETTRRTTSLVSEEAARTEDEDEEEDLLSRRVDWNGTTQSGASR